MPTKFTVESERLAAAGWREGSASDFLGLNREETFLVEIKFALTRLLRQSRQASGMTQLELAARLGSGQSRVAKIEAADRSVSMDLLLRALLVAGASPQQIAGEIQDVAAAAMPEARTEKLPARRSMVRRRRAKLSVG